MANVYFFEINQIPKDEVILDQLKKQEIFFSYFPVNQKYCFLSYNKKSIEIDFFVATVNFIK